MFLDWTPQPEACVFGSWESSTITSGHSLLL